MILSQFLIKYQSVPPVDRGHTVIDSPGDTLQTSYDRVVEIESTIEQLRMEQDHIISMTGPTLNIYARDGSSSSCGRQKED